jgi:ATP-dependent DNA helicase RecQ
LHYLKEKQTCKNRLILAYFGEKTNEDCGICSYCISKKKVATTTESISAKILSLLQTEELNSREIQNRTHADSEIVIATLKELLEKELITIKANNKYSIHI